MNQKDLPLGFAFVLAENPDALKAFSTLPEERRTELLQKVRSVSSRDEMQSFVNQLGSAQ